MLASRYSTSVDAESSSRTSYNNHQYQHRTHSPAASAYDDTFRSFCNLTLSSHPSEETSTPSRSRVAASMPHTVGDVSISATGSDRWMDQINPANVISPRLPDQVIPYPSRNNILSGSGGYTNQHQFPVWRAPVQNIQSTPVNMLTDILCDPYSYMTSPTTYRLLENLLDEGDGIWGIMFRDCLVRAILKSEDLLVSAIRTDQGSSVIQKLIKSAKHQPLIAALPRTLADHTSRLMTDQSGMHVVRKCFIELDYQKYKPLFNKLMENDNWLEMAKDKYGCGGLNECLDYMTNDSKSLLLRRITNCAQDLALDHYGTHVVQHVIDMHTIHTEEIVTSLIPVYHVLCTTKNGSHLVEKCLKTPHTRTVVAALIRSGKVLRFACHEFGNYVIQAAIMYTKENNENGVHHQLMRQLHKGKYELQNSRFGRNVARHMNN